MYEVYDTKGYVLSSFASGEADKVLSIFTNDFGLLKIKAQGIRLEKSKLRYSAEDYSKLKLSLVKGKNSWRLVNADSDINLYSTLKDQERFKMICRIFNLLERLLQGEEGNANLFKIVDNAVTFLISNEISKDNILDFECVIVLRILNNLGYIGDNKTLNFFTIDSQVDNKFVEEMKIERKNALREINRALKESQL